MNFDKALTLGFKIRMGMRKKNHYHLRLAVTDVLVLDPKCLGPRMELLLPALDPDFVHNKKHKKK